jgi:hypothetical protein
MFFFNWVQNYKLFLRTPKKRATRYDYPPTITPTTAPATTGALQGFSQKEGIKVAVYGKQTVGLWQGNG